jgi:hypothetical protein
VRATALGVMASTSIKSLSAWSEYEPIATVSRSHLKKVLTILI